MDPAAEEENYPLINRIALVARASIEKVDWPSPYPANLICVTRV